MAKPRVRKKATRVDSEGKVRSYDRIKKGIYLAPNLVTSMGMIFGLIAISKTFEGDFVKAAWAIVIAGFFDGMDGKIARLTKTTSEFGIQLDSLADLVSFGVAPGVLVYQFALRHSFAPSMGWAVAALFTICGALRLARFNVQTHVVDGRWFVGMPIPAGAGIVVSSILFFNEIHWITDSGTASLPTFFLLVTLVVSVFMISTVPFWAMKDVEFFKKHAFGTLFFFIIFMVILVREPERTLFIVGMIYFARGPFLWILRRRSDKPLDVLMEVEEEAE